jgi:hypothetical protein
MHCALRGKSPTVTTEKTFTVDPWCLREPELDLDALASTEAVLTVANGNLGVRGTLDEGEPVGHPGTYLAGMHELRTMVYTETGNGDPEATETLVNTIDGTVVRLLVDGHPLDVRTGTLQQHERVLDFRAGTLERRLRGTSSSPRSRTSATPSTTRPTACTSPRWPVRGSRWSAASAACGTRTRVVLTPSCRSGPRCPRSCRGCATGCCSAVGCCG